MFITLVFAAIIACLPYAASADDCTSGPACTAYEAPATGMKPAIPDMVCITFVQNGHQKVVLNMYDIYNPDNVTDPTNHLVRAPLSKEAGPNGQFCVGRAWIEKSTWIMICNGENWYDLRLAAFPDQVASGSVTTCLLGTAGCA